MGWEIDGVGETVRRQSNIPTARARKTDLVSLLDSGHCLSPAACAPSTAVAYRSDTLEKKRRLKETMQVRDFQMGLMEPRSYRQN